MRRGMPGERHLPGTRADVGIGPYGLLRGDGVGADAHIRPPFPKPQKGRRENSQRPFSV